MNALCWLDVEALGCRTQREMDWVSKCYNFKRTSTKYNKTIEFYLEHVISHMTKKMSEICQILNKNPLDSHLIYLQPVDVTLESLCISIRINFNMQIMILSQFKIMHLLVVQ